VSTYLAVGSVCWDVVEGSDEARLGGSVLFASRVAQAAGWQATVITSGTAGLEEALRRALPGIEVVVQRSAEDTVMWFPAAADLGPQAVPTVADPIDLGAGLGGRAVAEGVDVVHLAPIMGEVTPELVGQVRGAPFVGITPQGLLRHREPGTGRLLRRPDLDAWWAGDVRAAVLSEDEHALVAEPSSLDGIALAITRGERGCTGRSRGEEVDVAGIELASVSPVGTIGAGDVFAAAFFLSLASATPFRAALEHANRSAADHVGGIT
jgi:hypothetical protein